MAATMFEGIDPSFSIRRSDNVASERCHSSDKLISQYRTASGREIDDYSTWLSGRHVQMWLIDVFHNENEFNKENKINQF